MKEKMTCEIIVMPSEQVILNLSRLLREAEIKHGTIVEIVVMKNQVTILAKKSMEENNDRERTQRA